MQSFSVRPLPQNKIAPILCFSAAGAGACITFAYLTAEKYRGILGILAIALITVAVFVYVKFLSSSYIYEVSADNPDDPLLVVTRRTGKRLTTLCRVAMADITDVRYEHRGEKHKTPYGTKKYVYCPTLCPPARIRLSEKNKYETAEILIEGTEELAAYLASAAKSARQTRGGNYYGDE